MAVPAPHGAGGHLGGAAATNTGMTAADVWRVLRANGWLIAGIMILSLLVGIGALFFNGSSVVGWVLLVGGVMLILTGILMNLDIYFQPTSLWNTIFMFGLIGGGVGLFAKGVRPHRAKA